MEGELIDLLREGGPLAVVSVVAIYVLVRDRKNNRRNFKPGNPYPDNPGPPLVNGRWQQEMRDAQRESNATLERLEEGMRETVRLLTLMDDRQKRG